MAKRAAVPAVAEAPSTNGTAHGPVIPQNFEEVALDAPYEGLRFTVWVDPPYSLYRSIFRAETTTEERNRLLALVCVAHNGWRDHEGHELPPMTEPGFWDALSLSLATSIIAKMSDRISQLPLATPKSETSK